MAYPPVVSHNSQQAADRIRRKQSATAKAKAAIANADKPPNRKERKLMQKAAEEEAARATTTPANGTVPTPAKKTVGAANNETVRADGATTTPTIETVTTPVNEIAKATSVPTNNETVKASSAAAGNEITHTFGTAPKFKPAVAQTASKLVSSGRTDSSATAPLQSTNAQKTDVVPPDPLRKNEATLPAATRRQVSMQFIEPTYSRARESDVPSTPRSMDYLTRPRYVRPSFFCPDLWADSPQQRAESELAERISARQRAERTATVAQTPTPATKVAAHQSDAQHVFSNRSWAIQSLASVRKEADQQGDAECIYPPLQFGRDPDQPPAPAVPKTAPQSDAQQLGIDKTPAKRKRSDVVQRLHGVPTAKTSEHNPERAKRLRVTDSPVQSEVSRIDESVVDSNPELESDREL
jgi:hypothetical protein